VTATIEQTAPADNSLEAWGVWVATEMLPEVPSDWTLTHRDFGQPSYCHRCGWEGIPNMEGGERSSYDPPRFAENGREVLRIVGARPSGVCPACGTEAAEDYDEHERALVLERRGHVVTRRVEVKVGRNDPCPCGSGRKHKKCHG
jgi:hypothetical protein